MTIGVFQTAYHYSNIDRDVYQTYGEQSKVYQYCKFKKILNLLEFCILVLERAWSLTHDCYFFGTGFAMISIR